jgi:asparagine synthase (glutamine-hydrolysing)
MCGIAGIIRKDGTADRKGILAMTEVIQHRGPDGSGEYFEKGLAFGHRRLSIIDLSDKGRQPMEYIGRYVINYNGEVYNYIELRTELVGRGYRFDTETDTEVIMAAFDHWGEKCLERFNGMFSFAIYDRTRKIIFCARDRFGVKPFYFVPGDSRFLFASEIKEFCVLDGWESKANLPRLRDFLLASGIHDHTKETLFQGVFQLMGGEYLVFDLKEFSFRTGRWYDPQQFYQEKRKDWEIARSEFKSLFFDSVKLRLRSDVKVGSCLSGGLDSSSIVCVMNALLREARRADAQETVSSCFEDAAVDERPFIDDVITRTQVVSHRVFPGFEDMMASLDRIVWHQDEPFGSTAIYSQWKVYEEARKHGLIVMLDGQGADEYLAGYSSFHRVHFRELLANGRLIALASSLRNYRKLYRKYRFDPFRDLLDWGLKKLLGRRLSQRIRTAMGRGWEDRPSWLKMDRWDDGELGRVNAVGKDTIYSEAMKETFFSSLPKLLHHQDRDAMAHSVEPRAPYLDFRLVESVFSMPRQFKVNRAITKFILRESLRDVVPSKILDRYDKLGFATPEGRWFRTHAALLRGEIEESGGRLAGLIEIDRILTAFDQAAKDGFGDTSLFWRIICAGRWARVFNVAVEEAG